MIGSSVISSTFLMLINLILLVSWKLKLVCPLWGSFFINLGLTESVSVDPLGRSGGVWVLWDPKKVSVTTIKMNTQVIHVNVKKNNFQDWVLSTVYASPLPRNRDVLWEDLIETAEFLNEPWTVIGDLNDTASYEEVRSFAADSNAGQRRKFSDNINKCKLVDMGSSGNKFTWNNGRQGLANVQKRLDRGLCNEEWRALFPEGMIQILPRTYSDHSPMVLHVLGKHTNHFIPRPFQF